MNRPFVPPPHRLAPDDVLAVEVIGAADTGFQDAREHLGTEHYVAPSGTRTGIHRVVTVPIAGALFRVPADWTEAAQVSALTEVRGTVIGAWDRIPVWMRLGFDYGFDFRMARPWHSVEVLVRGTTGKCAFGWRRIRDAGDPLRGVLLPPPGGSPGFPTGALDGVTHVLLLVYGDA